MKEKIFEILHNRKRMPGEHFSDIEGRVEELVNQEVEKRIKERMPSEEAIMREADLLYSKEIFIVACEWLRSRLTCSEKPNNSQKTEGGAK